MAKNGNIHPTRIFKTPEDLLKAWEAFKLDVEKQSNEWLKVQYVGKEGNRVTDGQKVPLTIAGFKAFCYTAGYGSVWQYLENKDGYYDDFVEMSTRIKEESLADLSIGGLLGFYKENLTSRIAGYADKKEVENSGVINITTPSESEGLGE